jgi:hypothetical protein
MPRCAVALRSRLQNGMVVERTGTGTAWHGMCESNIVARCKSNGKDKSKPLAARHGKGTAWEWHGMCELAVRPSPPFIMSFACWYTKRRCLDVAISRTQLCRRSTICVCTNTVGEEVGLYRNGFGGLGGSMLAVGFFRAKKSSACLPSEGK